MNRRELLSLVGFIGLGSLVQGCGSAAPHASPAAPATAEQDEGPGAAAALAGFAGQLYAGLTPDHGNLVFSPWSIAMVLSMVREGAVGETAGELDTVLGSPWPGLGDGLAAGARALRSARGTLNYGNSLWGQRDLAWKDPFLDRLDRVYGAPLRRSDFRSDPEAARREINDWVDQQTKGKIPELLTPDLVDAAVRLVLVNALHFKAPWAEPMAEAGKLPFTTAAGAKVKVPTLAGAGTWPWLSNDELDATALPCDGGDFAMVVILPKDQTATAGLNASVFGEVLAAPAMSVTVQLPAWKFKQRVLLNELLQHLGVELAFDPDRADFSAMTDQERLCLAFVVHEALIEVNAKGIEAAAATAAGMRVGSGSVLQEVLVLDRPFTYALMHVPTTTPLFLGRVADPTQQLAT